MYRAGSLSVVEQGRVRCPLGKDGKVDGSLEPVIRIRCRCVERMHPVVETGGGVVFLPEGGGESDVYFF